MCEDKVNKKIGEVCKFKEKGGQHKWQRVKQNWVHTVRVTSGEEVRFELLIDTTFSLLKETPDPLQKKQVFINSASWQKL